MGTMSQTVRFPLSPLQRGPWRMYGYPQGSLRSQVPPASFRSAVDLANYSDGGTLLLGYVPFNKEQFAAYQENEMQLLLLANYHNTSVYYFFKVPRAGISAISLHRNIIPISWFRQIQCYLYIHQLLVRLFFGRFYCRNNITILLLQPKPSGHQQ